MSFAAIIAMHYFNIAQPYYQDGKVTMEEVYTDYLANTDASSYVLSQVIL